MSGIEKKSSQRSFVSLLLWRDFPVMFALVAEAAGMYYFSPIPQHFHSNSDGFVLRL